MVIKRIAVGVDGSEGAERALSWAADLAKAFDAEIFAVHVVPESWLLELNAIQLKTDDLVAARRARLVGEWTAVLREQNVSYLTEFLDGNPAEELLRIAQERHVDLVVVGGTRHHGIRRDALLGHTAHRVANHSTLPVVVVPLSVDDSGSEWVPLPG
jgi:nucleotide-binding universal stress UspA family protein